MPRPSPSRLRQETQKGTEVRSESLCALGPDRKAALHARQRPYCPGSLSLCPALPNTREASQKMRSRLTDRPGEEEAF